jgi:hypothetical protein
MQTAYVIKGHISDEGTVVLDEPARLAPGPVLVTTLPVEASAAEPGGYSDDERAELRRRIAAIAALEAPGLPDDGLSAKDYKEILYGSRNGAGDVR